MEIRDFGAYIHGKALRGAGGIPVGTGGNAAILISGGIDSPVAAYMMAKRGIRLTAIHFASPPYTSERAEQKVVKLLKKVARYSGNMNMYTVPFTEIQETIRKKCPEDYFTIIMRRGYIHSVDCDTPYGSIPMKFALLRASHSLREDGGILEYAAKVHIDGQPQINTVTMRLSRSEPSSEREG